MLKSGTPSKYSEEIADRICDLIADGKSLRAICRDIPDMPNRSTVLAWLREQPSFQTKYGRARDAQADHEHDDMMRIEDEVLTGSLDPQAARVVLLSKQWRASKLAPKKYGDKLSTEVSGAGGGPLVVTWLPPGSGDAEV